MFDVLLLMKHLRGYHQDTHSFVFLMTSIMLAISLDKISVMLSLSFALKLANSKSPLV